VAQVSRPHGISGELRLRLYNPDSRLLVPGLEVLLRGRGAEQRHAVLERVRDAGHGARLAKVRGIDDPDRAAELRGAQVCVPRGAFPALDHGEFYVCDLVGATVVGPSGELGTVEGIASYPTSDALVVRLTGTERETVEIPLLDTFVDAVDIERGVVVARQETLELLR